MTKKPRRSLAQVERAKTGLEKDVKSGRISKARVRAMRGVADLIRKAESQTSFARWWR